MYSMYICNGKIIPILFDWMFFFNLSFSARITFLLLVPAGGGAQSGCIWPAGGPPHCSLTGGGGTRA